MSERANNNESTWADSATKALLIDDIRTGKITYTMPPKVARELRVEYKEMDVNLFRSRLYALKKQLQASDQRKNDDKEALAHDHELFPKRTHNSLGLPNWDGSEAQQLLKGDIDNNQHNIMKPKELYESRLEYQVFTLKVFRGHIYQEIKTRKYLAQLAS